MVGKFVCLFAVLATIAAVANSQPGGWSGADASRSAAYAKNGNLSHNLIVGARQPGDRLVLKQNVYKASATWQIVTMEQLFAVSKWETITQVRALDQKINGNGATASLLNGGPGAKNVTLRFKSKRGHSIKFVVELYAR